MIVKALVPIEYDGKLYEIDNEFTMADNRVDKNVALGYVAIVEGRKVGASTDKANASTKRSVRAVKP